MKIGNKFKLQQGKKWAKITPEHTMEVFHMNEMFFYFKILDEPSMLSAYNAHEEFEDFFEFIKENK